MQRRERERQSRGELRHACISREEAEKRQRRGQLRGRAQHSLNTHALDLDTHALDLDTHALDSLDRHALASGLLHTAQTRMH